MSNETDIQIPNEKVTPVMGIGVHSPDDHCLCGMPHCNCGHWSDFHQRSDRMHGTPDQRINTSDTK